MRARKAIPARRTCDIVQRMGVSSSRELRRPQGKVRHLKKSYSALDLQSRKSVVRAGFPFTNFAQHFPDGCVYAWENVCVKQLRSAGTQHRAINQPYSELLS